MIDFVLNFVKNLKRIWIGAVQILMIIIITIRAVFKWLSKVIRWLRLLRLVIGLKDSRQFFNRWKATLKPIAPCTRDFSRALSEIQIIARHCHWFVALFVPVVTGRSLIALVLGFRQSFESRSIVSIAKIGCLCSFVPTSGRNLRTLVRMLAVPRSVHFCNWLTLPSTQSV